MPAFIKEEDVNDDASVLFTFTARTFLATAPVKVKSESADAPIKQEPSIGASWPARDAADARASLSKKQKKKLKRAARKEAKWEKRRLAVLGRPKSEDVKQELKVVVGMNNEESHNPAHDTRTEVGGVSQKRSNGNKNKKKNKQRVTPSELAKLSLELRRYLKARRSALIHRLEELEKLDDAQIGHIKSEGEDLKEVVAKTLDECKQRRRQASNERKERREVVKNMKALLERQRGFLALDACRGDIRAASFLPREKANAAAEQEAELELPKLERLLRAMERRLQPKDLSTDSSDDEIA